MAVRVPFTHGWSRLTFFLKYISAIGSMILGAWLVDEVLNIDSNIVLAVGFFGPPVIFILFVGKYFDILSTYLYVRLSLHTKISYGEASELMFLFEPNESGKWYPMRNIKSLPKDERRLTLFKTAQSIKGKALIR